MHASGTYLLRMILERIERAIEELKRGKIIVLVDDEDRENEGDLVCAAELCTAETVNFMAKHARGLICLTLTEEWVKRLDLPMMASENQSQRGTAFTVSIEANEGVSTGISAQDRAHTIRVAVQENAKKGDVVTPGHIFPLRARPGGVLQRAGHTEGSVDLVRLAGLRPAGVICEIMNDDGTMARMPDLQRFAKEHGLVVVSIADLVQYRLRHEQFVEKRATGSMQIRGHEWTAHVFRSGDDREFLALTLGKMDSSPCLVRMHSASLLLDGFRVDVHSRFGLDESVDKIVAEGRGAIVIVPQHGTLEDTLQIMTGAQSIKKSASGDVLREYGLGAQVLKQLGLSKIRLLSKRSTKLVGLEGYGLELIDTSE